MKKHVYKVGDKVRVVTPKWVKRVGYPLVWYDIEDEVRDDPRTHAAFTALGCSSADVLMPELPREFIVAVAKLRVRERGFGGRERSIHYHDLPGPLGRAGAVYEVIGKRTVRTGRYYPAGYWVDTYSGEQDGHSGGLTDAKSHVLLNTAWGEIEACNVEPA